jgi:biofilm PGA synthesis N-glycosyltransferase PgaC
MLVFLGAYLLFTLGRFIYQTVVGLFYLNPAKKFDRRYQPLVSVIVPAWNEAVGIEKTLRSILRSSYKHLEILVINDGSKDATSETVEKLQSKLIRAGRLIRLVEQRNRGKAAALNNGIKKSKGEIVVTIDADSYITKGSIRELVRALSHEEYDAAIGEIVIGNTKSLIGRTQRFEYLAGFHFRRAQHNLDSIYIFPGALTAFRRSLLKKAGKFEVGGITEDLDMSMKIRAMGHKVAYVDTAICITEGASTIGGLLNQRIRWRHGFLESLNKRRDFVWSAKKGKYLSYVEFPLSIVGLLEILLYPVIFVFLMSQLLGTHNWTILLLSYSFLPFILFLLNDLNGGEEKSSIVSTFLFPLTMVLVNMIEFTALIISIQRMISGQQTGWTVWDRTGADS